MDRFWWGDTVTQKPVRKKFPRSRWEGLRAWTGEWSKEDGRARHGSVGEDRPRWPWGDCSEGRRWSLGWRWGFGSSSLVNDSAAAQSKPSEGGCCWGGECGPFDRGSAEFKMPVGWETKICVWSSGEKSGAVVCVSEWQLQTQIWDNLTRKEWGNQVKDKAWGSAKVVWILCKVHSDGRFFGNCSSRNSRLQMNPFPRHPGPGSNLWVSRQDKTAKGFSFPWLTYFNFSVWKKKKSYSRLRFPLLLCNTVQPVPWKPPAPLLSRELPCSYSTRPGAGQCQQVEIYVVNTDRWGNPLWQTASNFWVI